MKLFSNYKLGFDKSGFILFLVILIPNFLWLIFPIPNDVLREETVTIQLDVVATIVQVFLIGSLCFLIPVDRTTQMNKSINTSIVVLLVFYYLSWIAYFSGFQNLIIIIYLALVPSIALLAFAIARMNFPAIIFASIFLITHTTSSIINYIY